MVPLLFRFAAEPSPAPTAKLVYVPEKRCNVIVSGTPAHDGTLLTKSTEGHDQAEVFADLHAVASDGTVLTCTSEARDAHEHGIDDLDRLGPLMGTKKTDSHEQSDPPDAVLADCAEAVACIPVRNTGVAPWPVSRFVST